MMLNNATDLNDLRVPPGNRLESLSGDPDGQYSVRINDQWRICFTWDDGDAYQAEIADYHLLRGRTKRGDHDERDGGQRREAAAHPSG